MSLNVEGVCYGSVQGKEALGGARRLETLHLALASSDRLMRVLGPIVGPQTLLMAAVEAKRSASAAVRCKLVRDHDLWSKTLFPDQLAHQPESGLRVASALHQHFEDLAFVVHRPPEPEPLSSDPDHHLVQVPRRARPLPPPSELTGKDRPELEHPSPDRLVRHIEPALGEQVLDVAEAQREPEIQLDGLPDDLGRETVTMVLGAGHRTTLPSGSTRRTRRT